MNLINKENLPESSANMVGSIKAFFAYAYSDEWIIDTGATNHMISDLKLLKNRMEVGQNDSKRVHLPNGGVSHVTHIGSCNMMNTERIDNVLYIHDFRYNLLSVSKITRALSCYVGLYPAFCNFWNLCSGKMKGIGRERGGLYLLPQSSTKRKRIALLRLVGRNKSQDIELWHRRLGHASIGEIRHSFTLAYDECKRRLVNYNVFLLAKHTRLPFNDSTNKVEEIFQLLHIDVWGPYTMQTLDGNKMFLTIIDDHSRMTWVYLLKLKSDVIIVLRNFLKLIQTQFNRNVKIIRTDNGTEFVNAECSILFQDYGILYQRTYVYTSQQNGIAERKHIHILEIARAMRFQGSIPLMFWGHCLLAVVYVMNRLPSRVLT